MAGASQIVSELPDGLKTYLGGTSANKLDFKGYTLGRIIPPKTLFTPVLLEEVENSEEERGEWFTCFTRVLRLSAPCLARASLATSPTYIPETNIYVTPETGLGLIDDVTIPSGCVASKEWLTESQTQRVYYPQMAPEPRVLSGGQWQKITNARAFCKGDTPSDLVVLDEPTSELDSTSEVAMFESIFSLRGKVSVFSFRMLCEAKMIFSTVHGYVHNPQTSLCSKSRLHLVP